MTDTQKTAELAEWELIAEGPHKVLRLPVEGGAIFLVHPTNAKGDARAPVLIAMPIVSPPVFPVERLQTPAAIAAPAAPAEAGALQAAAIAQQQLDAALHANNPHAAPPQPPGPNTPSAPVVPFNASNVHAGDPGQAPDSYGMVPAGGGAAQAMLAGFLYDDEARAQFTIAIQKRLTRAAPSLNGWYSLKRLMGKSGQRPGLHTLYNMPDHVIANSAGHVFGLLGFTIQGDHLYAFGPDKQPKTPENGTTAPGIA